jgi:hypothetical protein
MDVINTEYVRVARLFLLHCIIIDSGKEICGPFTIVSGSKTTEVSGAPFRYCNAKLYAVEHTFEVLGLNKLCGRGKVRREGGARFGEFRPTLAPVGDLDQGERRFHAQGWLGLGWVEKNEG